MVTGEGLRIIGVAACRGAALAGYPALELCTAARLAAATSHRYAPGGSGAMFAEHLADAAHHARRTGRLEAVHAHRHGAACNERCVPVSA